MKSADWAEPERRHRPKLRPSWRGIRSMCAISQTLHGTAIYADQLTPMAPPQLIGIYMAVPWSVWVYAYV